MSNRHQKVLFAILLLVAFSMPLFTKAERASFYISPSEGSYNKGDEFSVDIMINVEGASVNAAEAVISFPSDKLKVLEISKSNSIFSLWAKEPTFSNSEGKIEFVGGLPSPGFIGREGKVFTVLFKAKDSGKVEVYFLQERILADDPQGKNISLASQETTYYINVSGLEVIIDNEGDPTNPRPLLYLDIKDEDLVVNYYEIEIEEKVFEVKKEESLPWQMPSLTPGDHLILVRAIKESGDIIENTAKVVVESILIPEIIFCPQKFSSGEDTLYITGSTMADSQVLVFLKENGIDVKTWKVDSDSQGSWFLKDEILLKPGVYEISAKTKDLRGAVSNSSKSCFMSASLSGLMMGSFIVTYKALALIVIVLLIILFNWLSYLIFRTIRTRKLIKAEIEDLKNKFYKEYNELKIDIEKQIRLLRETREELTYEEKEREKELLKNLYDIEKVLSEELKDIEKIE